MAASVASILDELSSLSLEDQEMIYDIIRRRIIEGRREGIKADYLAALDERAQGLTRSGSVSDLFAKI